jgi:5'-nucleotidase
MNTLKPLILVTNDDGVSAPGLRALIAVMAEIGDSSRSDKPQSGMGHAITTNSTLYLKQNPKMMYRI